MHLYDICNCKSVWRNCSDVRPYLIVEIRTAGLFGCFPISGECYGGSCFWVSDDHQDFPHTGLSKSSYIHDTHIVELGTNQMLSRLGRLQDDLLDEFVEFAGL